MFESSPELYNSTPQRESISQIMEVKKRLLLEALETALPQEDMSLVTVAGNQERSLGPNNKVYDPFRFAIEINTDTSAIAEHIKTRLSGHSDFTIDQDLPVRGQPITKIYAQFNDEKIKKEIVDSWATTKGYTDNPTDQEQLKNDLPTLFPDYIFIDGKIERLKTSDERLYDYALSRGARGVRHTYISRGRNTMNSTKTYHVIFPKSQDDPIPFFVGSTYSGVFYGNTMPRGRRSEDGDQVTYDDKTGYIGGNAYAHTGNSASISQVGWPKRPTEHQAILALGHKEFEKAPYLDEIAHVYDDWPPQEMLNPEDFPSSDDKFKQEEEERQRRAEEIRSDEKKWYVHNPEAKGGNLHLYDANLIAPPKTISADMDLWEFWRVPKKMNSWLCTEDGKVRAKKCLGSKEEAFSDTTEKIFSNEEEGEPYTTISLHKQDDMVFFKVVAFEQLDVAPLAKKMWDAMGLLIEKLKKMQGPITTTPEYRTIFEPTIKVDCFDTNEYEDTVRFFNHYEILELLQSKFTLLNGSSNNLEIYYDSPKRAANDMRAVVTALSGILALPELRGEQMNLEILKEYTEDINQLEAKAESLPSTDPNDDGE